MMFYEYIHSAYEKLKKGEELAQDEIDEIVKLLDKAMGKWVPTPEELLNYKQNVDDVQRYKMSLSTVNLVQPLIEKMNRYNDKYHFGE